MKSDTKPFIVPEARYHPSIRDTPSPARNTPSPARNTPSPARNTPGPTWDRHISPGAQVKPRPEGGAAVKSVAAQQRNTVQPQVRYHPSISAKMDRSKRPGAEVIGTGPREGPKEGQREGPNTAVAGGESHQFSEVQPQKNLRKKTRKSRNLGSGSSDKEAGPKCEQEARASDATGTAAGAAAGAAAGSAAGDLGHRGAKSKKSKDSKTSAKLRLAPGPQGLPGLDPVLLETRPGSSLDQDLVDQVEARTRGQRTNPDWFRFRQNRITASVAHAISHCRFVSGKSPTAPASYIRKVLGESSQVQTRAMKWGIEHESEAVLKYQEQQSAALGRPIAVLDCGLFIDRARPWLAASPDGIVTDGRTGQWLRCLEVKCPFKHRERFVHEAAEDDPSFCLKIQQGAQHQQGVQQFSLKRSHPYFTQVQCQLAVTGLKMADFVVFTLRDLAVVQVQFDPDFWDQTVTKLEQFYSEAVIPALRVKNPAWNHEI